MNWFFQWLVSVLFSHFSKNLNKNYLLPQRKLDAYENSTSKQSFYNFCSLLEVVQLRLRICHRFFFEWEHLTRGRPYLIYSKASNLAGISFILQCVFTWIADRSFCSIILFGEAIELMHCMVCIWSHERPVVFHVFWTFTPTGTILCYRVECCFPNA